MSVIPLFYTPIYTCENKFKINDTLLSDINNIKKHRNKFNSMSDNYNVLKKEQFKSLNDYCLNELKGYFKNVVSCNSEIYITTSWFNYTEKNESHHIHNHPNSIISGVLYLSGKNSIRFHRDDMPFCLDFDYEEYNLANSAEWYLNLSPGELILFPSKLKHSVNKYTHDETRISLAFNTFVKGEINSQVSRLEIK